MNGIESTHISQFVNQFEGTIMKVKNQEYLSHSCLIHPSNTTYVIDK